ncbi:unnamed protein product [Didymodactylos carnosus]|uniref:Kynurenine 3-monooxygenase n=1 Tax=Didymodactylos carnosus TaxID=1234261 RepID=A0A813VN68_9BILA|nr:unnamed protein product [Didymodactylos carnosus]CAF3633358.1 unnamed protein product [Didymodactylos carnosus]
MDDKHHTSKTVAVVGGGLCGALCACFFGKHGIKVHLFELRSDIRQQEVVVGRSINMALSKRGRDALNYVDCEDLIVKNGIPMYARMIHDLDTRTHPIPYGTSKDQHILSIDRRILNELLLTEADKYPNITIHFEHKFFSWDPDQKKAVFYDGNGERREFSNLDAIIGCDGSYSAVRNALMKFEKINFSQDYVPSHYMEFRIAPMNGEFAMETNHLHIWPRREFMLIALPNLDKSFTTTLFLPINIFNAIQTEDQLIDFFQTYFPDAIYFIGKKNIITNYFSSKPLPLISIKCAPHHSSSASMVILGDAAHAMQPFYAQGMNSSFEDCLILFEQLNAYNFDFKQAFLGYSEQRVANSHAIVDLSYYNYLEMRDHVSQTSYLVRKKVDNLFYRLFSSYWIPLYSMIAFTRIPYLKCLQLKQRQDKILKTFRVISYTIFGLYLFKEFAIRVIKPLAIKFIVRKILPNFVAEKVV